MSSLDPHLSNATEHAAKDLAALRSRIDQLQADLGRAHAQVLELEESLERLGVEEARFRFLCDQTPKRMGVVELLDEDTDDLRIVWVNRAFLNFYQVSLDQVVGRLGRDLGSTPESRKPWLEAYWRAWRIQQPVTVEIFEARHDSWIQATLAPLREPGSTARRLGFIVINITERKKSELARKQSEERWRLVMSHLPTVVWMVDAQLVFRLSDGKGLESLGLEPNEVVGKPLTEYLQTEDPTFIPLAAHHRALAGESSTFIIERNGRHFSCFVSPVRQAGGNIDGAIGIAIDITDRKVIEASLRESEQRFRMLFENSPDAIFVEDLDGFVLDANEAACKLHSLSRRELIGRNLLDLVPTHSREAVREDFRRLTSGEIHELVSFSLNSDGTAVPIELTSRPITYGGRRCVLINVRDITERQSAEATLRSSQALEKKLLEAQKLESLGVLAGGIAHDFNNLLAVILGNASILDGQLPPESPMRSSLEPIVRTSERAAELCKQMLAYSGRGKFIVEPINLNGLVEEMAGLLKLSVPKKVTLRTHLAPDLPLIEADGTQIRQIVMNLVINGAEAIGDDVGFIDIQTSSNPPDRDGQRTVLLEIADSGSGMDEPTRDKIFDPFFTTKFTGRGLGLATVQGIVRGHKGTIDVESEPGRGSKFRITLPATLKNEQATASAPRTLEGTQLHGRILVVDDEPGIRQLMSRMLKPLGFETVVAFDGEDGLERFREAPESFCLVFLDLTMPRLDGEETFRLLHLMRPELPVILMSGYSEQEAAAKFVGKNVAGFITKPFTMTRLEEKIRSVLPGT